MNTSTTKRSKTENNTRNIQCFNITARTPERSQEESYIDNEKIRSTKQHGQQRPHRKAGHHRQTHRDSEIRRRKLLHATIEEQRLATSEHEAIVLVEVLSTSGRITPPKSKTRGGFITKDQDYTSAPTGP